MNPFEPLQHMESFSEDMFNRIIAFQEKQHPAWNPALGFDERIRELPLHYLVFSNADRDPARFAPTVAHYYPLRQEMRRLSFFIRQTQPHPSVCELYGGNGFLGSLLARELPPGAAPVTGLRAYSPKPNQIESFCDTERYRFSNARLQDGQFDAVYASWIPSGLNPTPEILAARPKLIIYVYTDHTNPQSGERQCGTEDMFDELNASYRLLDEWSSTRPENLFHDIWPDLTPSIEETRHTRIYARPDCAQIHSPQSLPQAAPYDWENELAMAQLALQAKRQIEAHGFLVR